MTINFAVIALHRGGLVESEASVGVESVNPLVQKSHTVGPGCKLICILQHLA